MHALHAYMHTDTGTKCTAAESTVCFQSQTIHRHIRTLVCAYMHAYMHTQSASWFFESRDGSVDTYTKPSGSGICPLFHMDSIHIYRHGHKCIHAHIHNMCLGWIYFAPRLYKSQAEIQQIAFRLTEPSLEKRRTTEKLW
jgi:hypothetical protein